MSTDKIKVIDLGVKIFDRDIREVLVYLQGLLVSHPECTKIVLEDDFGAVSALGYYRVSRSGDPK